MKDEEEPKEIATLDMNKVKANIPSYSNEKLAEMVVCDRYFGFGEKISVICMEELSKRRSNGDTFDFEGYIDKSYKELPVLNLNLDIRAILQQAINNMGAKIKK